MKRAESSTVPLANLTLEEILELIATRVAAKVVSAQSEGARAGTTYSSTSLPPGMSRKRFNELCRQRSAQGDKSIRKIGRVWVAPSEAFEKRARPGLLEKVLREPWSPEAILGSVGVRPTR